MVQGERRRTTEGIGTAELRDSSWDQKFYNTKKNVGISERSRVSMLETAAYTMSRRQIETRGWVGNLEVGSVTPGPTLTAEELEASKASRFKSVA